MVAPTFNQKEIHILSITINWLIQCVQSEPGLSLPARLLLHDSLHPWPWKASAHSYQGCEPALAFSLSFPLSLSLSNTHTHTDKHAHHLHSRLLNELKKPSCVLDDETETVLADTYHPINPGRDSLNKENYVRAQGCQ